MFPKQKNILGNLIKFLNAKVGGRNFFLTIPWIKEKNDS